jgi:dTDP-glucose 4,6-dehydratase
MSVYLVTGAAGFIASNYVHHVRGVEPEAVVIGVDYLGFASNLANLPDEDGRFSFRRADIADRPAMEGLLAEFSPDYVVNFAAESHNDRAINDPDSFMRSNALGVQALLEACRRTPADRTVVHVSTIEVYGELGASAQAFNEASPLNAKTPYSAAKAAGDLMARAYMHTYHELDVRMTHCANNYGPYQLPEKLIPLAITNVLRGRKVPVYGDGGQSRDWLHVLDHCRAIHQVAHAGRSTIDAKAALDPSLLPIYDVSAYKELTNLDILGAVLGHLEVDPAEFLLHVGDRPNHDRRYIIDSSKIRADLGWLPTIDFDEGLRDTVRWYVENRPWWEAVFADKGDLEHSWA